MTEFGSDEQLERKADTSAVNRDARREAWRSLLEEWRTRMQPTEALGEPGEQFPDPDETPPGNPPEYDPLPPKEI